MNRLNRKRPSSRRHKPTTSTPRCRPLFFRGAGFVFCVAPSRTLHKKACVSCNGRGVWGSRRSPPQDHQLPCLGSDLRFGGGCFGTRAVAALLPPALARMGQIPAPFLAFRVHISRTTVVHDPGPSLVLECESQKPRTELGSAPPPERQRDTGGQQDHHCSCATATCHQRHDELHKAAEPATLFRTVDCGRMNRERRIHEPEIHCRIQEGSGGLARTG